MKVISRRSGFSLVELLTVIAIIAILAAIIFPVMSRVKDNARQTACMTNLHQVGLAIQAFKLDNRRYPTFLGAQALDSSGQPISGPGSQVQFESAKAQTSSLFPEYVKGSYAVFHCASSRTPNTLDVQAYETIPGSGNVVWVYKYDSYGAHDVGSLNAEPHYRLNWATGVDKVASPDGQPLSAYPPKDGDSPTIQQQDYERQLRWRNPPGDTVVTWCSNHEDRSAGPSAQGSWGGRCPVVFLDGHADNMPANEVEQCKWRVRPKKS